MYMYMYLISVPEFLFGKKKFCHLKQSQAAYTYACPMSCETEISIFITFIGYLF